MSQGVRLCVPFGKAISSWRWSRARLGFIRRPRHSERVAFRQINKATGNRLRQQLVDEETREPVGPEHKGRGYEIGKGQYLIVEDEELEAIEIESTHTIEIDRFVPRAKIDQRFFDTPYYVAPTEPVGHDAFAVIREAMRGKAMVALGRLVLAKRERVIALEPYDKGLARHYAALPLRDPQCRGLLWRSAGDRHRARHAGAGASTSSTARPASSTPARSETAMRKRCLPI